MVKTSRPSFCPQCGGELTNRFVVEEGRERLVCGRCGRIHYLNPPVVAGAIATSEGRLWLLRRAIEPRYGAWTYPAGFMEMGESVREAAARETREELNLEIRILDLLGVYSRSTMSNVVVVFVAESLTQPSVGHETLEFASFSPAEIPWAELAFWSTHAALRDWLKRIS